MLKTIGGILGAAFLVVSAAGAQTAEPEDPDAFVPGPKEIFLAQLAGEWRGVITYVETSAPRRTVQVPVAITGRTPADGSYAVMETTYLDPTLYIFAATIVTASDEVVTETYAREGAVEAFRYNVERITVSRNGGRVDATLTTTAREADRPADIRILYTINGDTMIRRKEVRFLDVATAPYVLRNELRLARAIRNPPRAPGVESLTVTSPSGQGAR